MRMRRSNFLGFDFGFECEFGGGGRCILQWPMWRGRGNRLGCANWVRRRGPRSAVRFLLSLKMNMHLNLSMNAIDLCFCC